MKQRQEDAIVVLDTWGGPGNKGVLGLPVQPGRAALKLHRL